MERRGFVGAMLGAAAALGLPVDVCGGESDERQVPDVPEGWTLEEWYDVPAAKRRLIRESGVAQPGTDGWQVLWQGDRGAGILFLTVDPEDVGGPGEVEVQVQARTQFDETGRWYPVHAPKTIELKGPTEVPTMVQEVGRVLVRRAP